MKLIALMAVRNESWCIRPSINAALRWCDGVVVYLDRNDDNTEGIASEQVEFFRDKDAVLYYDREEAEHWDEMDKRQRMLELGRMLGGTHFAMVDADEILTHNNLGQARGWVEALEPGEVLELPMVPVWGDLDKYRKDHSIWSHVWLSTAFCDRDVMGWAPRGAEKYHYHNRTPHGWKNVKRQKCDGGVFHLQWASKRRVIAKHWAYVLSERIRWPNRKTPAQLSEIYSQALDERGMKLVDVPPHWWGDYLKNDIDLDHVPWHEDEVRRMLEKYGEEAFKGIQLIEPRPI